MLLSYYKQYSKWYSTLAIDKEGKIVSTICVYFYNDPLPNTSTNGAGVELTNDRVIELVNTHWTQACRRLGKMGEYVPSFMKADQIQTANVRVRYIESKSK